jgi:hypothetical protein
MEVSLRILAFSFLVPTLAAQSTIHVPADVPTIQGAIVQAQNGDTVLVAPGTYAELIDYLGKAITVASTGGPSVTTIDASGLTPTGLFEAVVTFHALEGPGSVLSGFTITGGYGNFRGGGISATLGLVGSEASPRIEGCVVRGNRTEFGGAGGVTGNATLVDCVIEDNLAPYSVGGVSGAPHLERCTIRGNQGYDAGGLQLFGGSAVDCVITGNASVEGTYGGGVFLVGAEPVLERCLIASNTAAALGPYPVASAGVLVYAEAGAPLIRNCTIVGNRILSSYVPPGEDCGGVRGHARLVNTIVRDNDGLDIGNPTGIQAVFSNIEGGHAGQGNFDLDPLFVDAANGDYHLAAGSPCIDTGAQFFGLDPDLTRADVGAFYFPQANAVVRNGNGVNPLLLSSVTAPRLGTVWHVRIDASLVPGATLSVITGRTRALPPGIFVPQGELLVDGPQIFGASLPSFGGVDDFFFPIPDRASLVGFEGHAQAVVIGAAGMRLGNALQIELGR